MIIPQIALFRNLPLPVRRPPQRTGRGAPRSNQVFAPNRADRGRGRFPLPNPAGQGEKGPRRQCAATGQGRPFREKKVSHATRPSWGRRAPAQSGSASPRQTKSQPFPPGKNDTVPPSGEDRLFRRQGAAAPHTAQAGRTAARTKRPAKPQTSKPSSPRGGAMPERPPGQTRRPPPAPPSLCAPRQGPSQREALAAQTGKALRCDAEGKRRIYCGKQSR